MLIDTVRSGRGIPIHSFIPAELAFSPADDLENRITYDPDYARSQLAASAYPTCADLPLIVINTYEGASGWAGYWVDAAVAALGCTREQFAIHQMDYADLRVSIDPDTPLDERPNAFTFGFGPDFNDASSFADVLACGAENYFGFQSCGGIDSLIQRANTSTDDTERADLYRAIEQAYFNRTDGLAPLIPLFQVTRYVVVRPWLTGPYLTDERFGVTYFDSYSIDAEARTVFLACTITSTQTVNLRAGAGINTDLAGSLQADTPIIALGKTRGTDGYTWWWLENGAYVREDVVEEDGYCQSLPPA